MAKGTAREKGHHARPAGGSHETAESGGDRRSASVQTTPPKEQSAPQPEASTDPDAEEALRGYKEKLRAEHAAWLVATERDRQIALLRALQRGCRDWLRVHADDS